LKWCCVEVGMLIHRFSFHHIAVAIASCTGSKKQSPKSSASSKRKQEKTSNVVVAKKEQSKPAEPTPAQPSQKTPSKTPAVAKAAAPKVAAAPVAAPAAASTKAAAKKEAVPSNQSKAKELGLAGGESDEIYVASISKEQLLAKGAAGGKKALPAKAVEAAAVVTVEPELLGEGGDWKVVKSKKKKAGSSE
jgi:flagellum-specific peptidoglycan hydrolase FlgJ